MGATDGFSFSNTYFFERELNWWERERENERERGGGGRGGEGAGVATERWGAD